MAGAKPAIVGGFLLSGAALGVAAILLFGGTQLFSRTVHAVVYFEGSVAGLDVGAPVTFRGVRVGSVAGIAVHLNVKDLTARIPVYLDLNPSRIALEDGVPGQVDTSFDRLLKAGLRAQLDMQSLITGELRVELDLQPGIAAPVAAADQDWPEIPSIPSKFQTLEDQVAQLPLKEIAENARETLAATRRVAEALADRVGPVGDKLTETADAAHATLDDVDRLAVAAQRQLAVTGNDLGRVLASADQMVQQTETLVASLKEMTQPNSRMRDDLQATTRDLAASASSLRGFTHEIERDPSAILSGRTSH